MSDESRRNRHLCVQNELQRRSERNDLEMKHRAKRNDLEMKQKAERNDFEMKLRAERHELDMEQRRGQHQIIQQPNRQQQNGQQTQIWQQPIWQQPTVMQPIMLQPIVHNQTNAPNNHRVQPQPQNENNELLHPLLLPLGQIADHLTRPWKRFFTSSRNFIRFFLDKK